MTSLERYEDRAPTLTDDPQDRAVKRLTEWATSAQAASTVAAELVRTSFVPESFRGKPHEATAAILSGLEMGLSPMAALRSFDVIQGQAAPRAITLRAVAQAHGHEIVLDESTATRCRMRGRRAGTHEWQTVTWTIDRARQLGLTNKHNWKVQPQAMLLARATAEIARLIAADAILGIAYTAEEIADGATGDVPVPVADTPVGPAAGEPAAVTPGTTRMTRRKPPADPATPEPVDAEIVDDIPAAPTLSEPQMKKLRALYGSIGVRNAAEQKRVSALILGIPTLDTHSTLTVEQASKIIDQLQAVEDGYVELVLDATGSVVGFTDAQPPTNLLSEDAS